MNSEDSIYNQPPAISIPGVEIPVSAPATPTTTGYDSGTSTISPADQTQESKNKTVPYNAANPALLLPLLSGTSVDTTMTVEDLATILHTQRNMQHSIVTDMLDSWIKNIQQIADETREKINSPEYRARQEAEDNVAVGTYQSIQNFLKSSNVDQVMALLMGSVAVVGGTSLVTSSSLVSTVENAITASMTAVPGTGSNMAAELGLLGAMMMSSVVGRLGLNVLAGAILGKSTNFAQDFAKSVLTLVNPDDQTVLNQVVARLPLTDAQKAKLVNQIKLILAYVALTVLYMKATGNVMDDETLNDLKKGILPPAILYNPEAMEIMTAIQANPEHAETNMLSALFDYLKSVRDPKQLTDPSEVFHGVSS